MDSLFGMVVFIVVIVASIAQKIQQSRAEARQRSEQPPQQPPEDLDSSGPVIRDARAREAQGQASRETAPPRPPGQELFEALFGPQKNRDDEEGDWQPVHEVEQRREAPRARREQTHRPESAPARRPAVQPRRVPVETVPHQRAAGRQQASPRREQHPARQPTTASPRRSTSTRQPAPKQRQKQQPKRQKSTPAPSRRQKPAAAPAQPAAARRRRALFANLDDVRRGIIMAEVLGPPKAFE